VILDIYADNLGHSLVIPKIHRESIFCIEDNILSDCFITSQKIAKAIIDLNLCDGLNILQNNNISAGQTVNHFHIHIIPRFSKDNIKISWQNKNNNENDLVDVAIKIKNKIKQ
jgi:histidine triad (HIT) family protein